MNEEDQRRTAFVELELAAVWQGHERGVVTSHEVHRRLEELERLLWRRVFGRLYKVTPGASQAAKLWPAVGLVITVRLLVVAYGDHRAHREAAVHVMVGARDVLLVARLIRAPTFFLAVGSQANIGGAASAPVVAAAFYPSLAPVGVLLAVLGYALGTYGGWVCGQLMRLVSQ